MSAHTPGPWHWLGSHSLIANHGNRPAVLTGRSELSQRDPESGRLKPFDADSADGRLIAAAPDLLAAVQIALESLDFDLTKESKDELRKLFRTVVTQARGK